MKKTIGLISNDITNGLAYQRGHFFFRHLKHKYDFVCKSTNELDHATALYFDAMIMLHPYTQKQAMMIQRAKGQYQIPVISDLDDLLTNMPSDHTAYWDFQNSFVNQIIILSDIVTTSTEYIKTSWGHLNKRIEVIPNQVDTERYKHFKLEQRLKPYHSGFVVGWTGGQSHRSDLFNTGFIDGLVKAMETHDDIRAYFHILCPDILLRKFGQRVIFNPEPVDFLDYPALCYTFPFDVCCVPLQDHPFNDAKSDLRFLDMAPFGIPILASPRRSFIDHPSMALLCSSDNSESWFNAIEGIYKNQELLRQNGELGREYVMRERTIQHSVQKWDRILSGLFP